MILPLVEESATGDTGLQFRANCPAGDRRKRPIYRQNLAIVVNGGAAWAVGLKMGVPICVGNT